MNRIRTVGPADIPRPVRRVRGRTIVVEGKRRRILPRATMADTARDECAVLDIGLDGFKVVQKSCAVIQNLDDG